MKDTLLLPLLPYEQQLANNPTWAFGEASLFFEGKGAVQTALRKLAARLNQLGIAYAVAGAMALFRHGYRRFTEDVNIVVRRNDVKAIHGRLVGDGYTPSFFGSKNLRDADCGVEIRFLVSGETPRHNREKPLPIPDPAAISVDLDGIMYVRLPALIEMKLTSGISRPDRLKDLADVQETIKQGPALVRCLRRRVESARPRQVHRVVDANQTGSSFITPHSKLPTPYSTSH